MRSTVRGLGDTPDDVETLDALKMLNEILDVLARKEDFSQGLQSIVFDKPNKGFVNFSDDPHRVVSITATPQTSPYSGTFKCRTESTHNLVQGDKIVLRVDGRDFNLVADIINSYREFTTHNPSGLSGQYYGSFKLEKEPDEKLIDVIMSPPVNIFQVVESGTGVIPERQQQGFYASSSGKWWFYVKRTYAYSTLYVNELSRFMVVFPRPCLRNVTLDTDFDNVDSAALSAIKYRLASEIAYTSGYATQGEMLLKKYKHAYATFVRSGAQAASPYPDLSAPGYFGESRYDIYNDGGKNATF